MDRATALANAYAYLKQHRDLLAPYITNVLPITEAQAAFELASLPAPGRLKVVLSVADGEPEAAGQ